MCEGKVELEELAAVELGEDCIFFIESSPKEVLSSREACALESAARNSELRVVMVRLGRSLDLADNTTCQVYNRWIFSMSLLVNLVHSCHGRFCLELLFVCCTFYCPILQLGKPNRNALGVYDIYNSMLTC